MGAARGRATVSARQRAGRRPQGGEGSQPRPVCTAGLCTAPVHSTGGTPTRSLGCSWCSVTTRTAVPQRGAPPSPPPLLGGAAAPTKGAAAAACSAGTSRLPPGRGCWPGRAPIRSRQARYHLAATGRRALQPPPAAMCCAASRAPAAGMPGWLLIAFPPPCLPMHACFEQRPGSAGGQSKALGRRPLTLWQACQCGQVDTVKGRMRSTKRVHRQKAQRKKHRGKDEHSFFNCNVSMQKIGWLNAATNHLTAFNTSRGPAAQQRGECAPAAAAPAPCHPSRQACHCRPRHCWLGNCSRPTSGRCSAA